MTRTSNDSPASALTASERDSMRWLRLTCAPAMTTGTVKALWRWPVIPLAGERLRSTRVEEWGVAGDRQHVLAGPSGPLTADDAPGLTLWRASFPFHPHRAIARARPGAGLRARPPPFHPRGGFPGPPPAVPDPHRAGRRRQLPLGRPAAHAP